MYLITFFLFVSANFSVLLLPLLRMIHFYCYCLYFITSLMCVHHQKTSFFFVLKVFLAISEVRGIVNVKCVRDGYQTVQAALLDYTLSCYPSIQVSE